MKKALFCVIGFVFFLTLATSLSKAASQIEAKDVANILPQNPVECRNELTCDRDPKHLEAFVAGFYRWYVADEIRLHALPWKSLPTKQHLQILTAFAKKNDLIMRKSLTPEFYHWREIFTADPPPDPDPRYCMQGGAILCFNGGNDDQVFNATAEAVDIKETQATVIVTLPAVQSGEFPYQLIAKLRVVNGRWRIDGVTRPSS